MIYKNDVDTELGKEPINVKTYTTPMCSLAILLFSLKNTKREIEKKNNSYLYKRV